MFDALFNNIVNTLIRDLAFPVRAGIAFGLFTVSLLCFMYSFRTKNDLRPLKIGWFIMFIICLTMSVLYVTL